MAFFATSEHLPVASSAWKKKGPVDPDPPIIKPPQPPPPAPKRYRIWHQCGEERWLGTNPRTGEVMWLCDQFFRFLEQSNAEKMGAQVRGKLSSKKIPQKITQDKVASTKSSYTKTANKAVINENTRGV